VLIQSRRQRVREYWGQIPSPDRPIVPRPEDWVWFWTVIAGVSEPVGYRWFLHSGGVNPRLASILSGRYLSSSNREEIALWRGRGPRLREVARRLGRSPSTMSRELRRNASARTYRLGYKASTAQWLSTTRKAPQVGEADDPRAPA
jgi:hypothetical protein